MQLRQGGPGPPGNHLPAHVEAGPLAGPSPGQPRSSRLRSMSFGVPRIGSVSTDLPPRSSSNAPDTSVKWRPTPAPDMIAYRSCLEGDYMMIKNP